MTPTALITGGQQGIGLGVALALQEAGFRLGLAAERPEVSRDPVRSEQHPPGAGAARQQRGDHRSFGIVGG